MQLSKRTSERFAQANRAKSEAIRERALTRRIVWRCACGVELRLPKSTAARKKYCSWACRQSRMRGANAPNWIDGTTKARQDEFRSGSDGALRWWSRHVIDRDHHSCRRCGATKNLHAHHIALFARHESLRLDLDNGICLCRDCHRWAHSSDNTQGLYICRCCRISEPEELDTFYGLPPGWTQPIGQPLLGNACPPQQYLPIFALIVALHEEVAA